MVRLFDNIKFLNRVSYLIGSLAIAIMLVSVLDYLVQNCFRVDHIVIEGNIQDVTATQFADIAENRLRGTLFTLDIAGLQREFRKISWVKNVSVARQFPNTVVIDVIEHQAVARFGENELLSKDGIIFAGADDSNTLPVFGASHNQVDKLFSDYAILTPFATKHNLQVKSLTLIEGDITRFSLSNNLIVTVCGADLANKIALLDQYWVQLYALNPNLSNVDMCYKNALAINYTAVKNTQPGSILRKQ